MAAACSLYVRYWKERSQEYDEIEQVWTCRVLMRHVESLDESKKGEKMLKKYRTPLFGLFDRNAGASSEILNF